MATKTFKIGLSATDKQNMAQDVYERILDLTFPEYDTTSSYSVGDFVVYNNQLYKCIGATSGAWDATKWQLATLNDLVEDIESAVAFVNDKANVDGNYPTLTAGLADNLTPYSEDSGDSQDNPFISQGTGTNNNNEIVTVGDFALFKEKQGNTLAVNQWVNPISGSITFSGGTAYKSFRDTGGIFSAGSKVLISCKLDFTNCPSAKQVLHINVRDGVHGNYINKDITLDSTGTAYEKLDIIYDNSNIVFFVLSNSTFSSNESIGYSKCICSSLTQMFNGDIPQDLLDHPEHFSWYYNGDLSYNTGTLVNANSERLVSTGRNIYNPSETYNIVIPNKPFFASKTTTITYYDKDKNSIGTESVSAGNTFTTPSNCVFISSSVSAITITPYYTDQEGGEGYKDNNSNTPIEYPYEEPTIVDTGNEVLRSAGSVKDYKTPDGTIHRLVGVVDLGTLNWGYSSESGHERFYSTTNLSDAKLVANNETINGVCSKYEMNTANAIYLHSKDKIIGVSNTGAITIYDSGAGTDTAAFKTAMSGVYLYYELAEPTTEQGTPFAENLPINDYGMLYWQESNGVPQGAEIFYPVNYKGFLDDIYSRTSGDAEQLVIQSELSASETQRDTVDTILQNAIGGTLRQLLASSQSLDFNDTDFIDLGASNWSYNSGSAYHYCQISGPKLPSSNGNTAKMLCTKYKTISASGVIGGTYPLTIGLTADGYIVIKDSSYTDATAFKAAMKGVLLAYEKA